MARKPRNDAGRGGFTLVELVVVLVILTILAALLVPTLTGYIDRANSEKAMSEARYLVMAVQTEVSTAYTEGLTEQTEWAEGQTGAEGDHWDAMVSLAELELTDDANGPSFSAEVTTDGQIEWVAYYDGAGYYCLYDGQTGQYTTTDDKNDLVDYVSIPDVRLDNTVLFVAPQGQ